MDNTSRRLTTARTRAAAAGRSLHEDTSGEKEAGGEESYDLEAWETLCKSFKEVQSVLDRNRLLIQQVNDNHMSRIPRNLARNVGLIREINANISRVVGLYADLSAKFSNIVHDRRASHDKPNEDSQS